MYTPVTPYRHQVLRRWLSPGSTSRPFPEAQADLLGQPAQAAALPASSAAGPTHPSLAFAGTLGVACCGNAGGDGAVDATSDILYSGSSAVGQPLVLRCLSRGDKRVCPPVEKEAFWFRGVHLLLFDEKCGEIVKRVPTRSRAPDGM